MAVAVVSAAWERCGCGVGLGQGRWRATRAQLGWVPPSHLLLEKKGILRAKKLGIRKPVGKAVPWGPPQAAAGARTRAVQRMVCGLH